MLKSFEQRGIYKVEQIYGFGRIEGKAIRKYHNYPKVREHVEKFPELREFYQDIKQKWFIRTGVEESVVNSGTLIFISAIQQGYTDIYVVGIDLDFSNWTYAFDYEKVPRENLERYHDLEADKSIFEFAKTLPGINIYSIVEGSNISKIFPLAPIQNENPYIPEEKNISDELKKEIQEESDRESKKILEYQRFLEYNDKKNKIYTDDKEENIAFLFFKMKKSFKNLLSNTKSVLMKIVLRTKDMPVLSIFYKILRKIYRMVKNK